MNNYSHMFISCLLLFVLLQSVLSVVIKHGYRNLQQQKRVDRIIVQSSITPIFIYPLNPKIPTSKYKRPFNQPPTPTPTPSPSPSTSTSTSPAIKPPQPQPITVAPDQYFKQITQTYITNKLPKPRTDLPFYCSFTRSNLQVPNYDGIKREKLVATNYGFIMYVDSKDLTVSNVIATGGTWEPGYIVIIGKIVREGDNVLNLGSQSGLQALVMGKIIGPTGKMFIFEPYSFSNMLVTKNIEINNMSSYTTIYKTGASDEKTTAQIKVSYWNTGGSQIHKKTPPSNSSVPFPFQAQFFPSDETQQIQVDLVDNLLPSDIKLNFALLDVEKMEIKALRGMRQVIERSPDLVIMTQWQYAGNSERNKQQTVQFLLWMVARKYRIYSYSVGDIGNCNAGKFHQLTNKIEQVLKITFLDIFFFPNHIPLPH